MDVRQVVNIDAEIDRRPFGVYQMFVVFLGALVLFIDGLDVQIVSFIGPKIRAEWGLSATMLGWVFSAGVFGLLVGFAFVSPLSVRFGNRALVFANILVFSLATMCAALARDVSTMIALRFLAGIGLGGVLPSAVAMAGEFSPRRRRGTSIALIYCGYSIGTVTAGLLAALVMTDLGYGWRELAVAGGLAPLVIALFLAFTLPESLEYLVARNAPQERIAAIMRRISPQLALEDTRYVVSEARAATSPVAQLFQNGRTLGTLMIWIALFVNLMVVFFLLQWTPSIFQQLGYSPAAATQFATLTTSGGIVAALILGPLMDWLGAYRVIIGLYGLGALMTLGAGLTAHSQAALFAGCAFIATGSVSGIQKCINALMVLFYPTALRSTGLGWAFGVGRFGAMIGPVLAGYLFDLKWPIERVYYVFAAPALLGAGAILAMYWTYRPGEGEAAATPLAAE